MKDTAYGIQVGRMRLLSINCRKNKKRQARGPLLDSKRRQSFLYY